MRVLVAGELNPDLVMRGASVRPEAGKEVLVDELALALGSASAICAAGLAKLGERVTFAGRIGADTWGDFCRAKLEEAGVDTSALLRSEKLQTGITVSISSASDRALVTYLGAIAELRESDIDDALLASHDHLHVSSFFLQRGLRPDCRRLFTRAREAGLTTSLDPGYDPEEKWDKDILDTLDAADVFLPNEVELAAIAGTVDPEHALRALDNGRTLTVAKLGENGAAALLEGRMIRAAAAPVSPVDTTGAGDSFNAGFLHAWLAGQSLPAALRFGCICGALSTQGVGGTAAQPSAAQVREYLEAHP